MSSSLEGSAHSLAAPIGASAWFIGALSRAHWDLFVSGASAAGELLPSSFSLLAKFVFLRLHDRRVFLENMILECCLVPSAGRSQVLETNP